MEKSDAINELLKLRNAYELEKLNLSEKKELLTQKKKEIYAQQIENIKEEINATPNNDRLQKYLESTYIKSIEFLYRSLIYVSGNNQQGSLSFHELLFLDEEVRNIGLEYDITSQDKLWKVLCAYYNYRISHPFLEDDRIINKMSKVQRLAYLDEIFKNIDNVLKYQGSYTVYQYVKNYLKAVLNDDINQTDNEVVYKDYNQKKEYVLNNLSAISTYLLNIREQTPKSRLALCNHGLVRMSRKLAGTGITFEQNIFASGIAFGTTLEKLKNENYEEAKNLIFIPHQNLLK